MSTKAQLGSFILKEFIEAQRLADGRTATCCYCCDEFLSFYPLEPPRYCSDCLEQRLQIPIRRGRDIDSIFSGDTP